MERHDPLRGLGQGGGDSAIGVGCLPDFRGAFCLVNVGPDEVAEVVLARGLVVVEADLDVLGDLPLISEVQR